MSQSTICGRSFLAVAMPSWLVCATMTRNPQASSRLRRTSAASRLSSTTSTLTVLSMAGIVATCDAGGNRRTAFRRVAISPKWRRRPATGLSPHLSGTLARAVRTGFLRAVGVERERVAVQLEAALARHLVLPALDLGVVELLDTPALQADEMVVVAALVQLEHRLAGLEMLAREQPGVLELREHAVNGGEADVDAFGDEHLVDVFGRKVAHLARLEQLEDLAARQRRLEAAVLQALHRAHRLSL